ncbi:MAG: hypothetical protein H7Y15_03060 [Pseudonocardia sp.]|nr:hypothetical protein [Pseudonocardia sp.]
MPDGSAPELLLVDVTGGQPVRAAEIGWETIADRSRRAVEGSLTGRYARTVPVMELLDDEVDLTPSRHLRPTGVDLSGLADNSAAVEAVLARLTTLIPSVSPAAPGRTVTLAELARAGALSIHASPARLELGGDDDAPPVLTARDVVSGGPASGRLGGESVFPTVELVPGDVVIPVVAPRPVSRVVTETGWLLGPNQVLVRPIGGAVDPWFLAGALRSERVLRGSTSASGVHRTDARRLSVPAVPLAEQRVIGEAFRRLDAFSRSLAQAADLGGELARTLVEGLAAGQLRPAGNDAAPGDER